MADLLQIKLILLNSPPFLSPLHNFSLTRSSPRKRTLSLSKLSSLSNSPKLHLVYTSERSDGSLLFKFGDEDEIPVERVETSNTASLEDVGDVVELERESESSLIDDVTSNVVDNNDVDNVDDTTPLLPEDIEKDVELESGSGSSVGNIETRDEIKVGDSVNSDLELKEIPEKLSDSVEDEQDHSSLISKLQVKDFVDSEIVIDDSVDVRTKEVSGVRKVDVVSENGVSNVENMEKMEDKESLVDGVSDHGDGEEELVELVELPLVQFEADPVLDEEVEDIANPTISFSEDSQMSTAEANLDRDSTVDLEIIPTAKLSASQAAAPSSHPSKVNDAGHQSITGAEDNLLVSIVSDVASPGSETSKVTAGRAISDSSYSGDISKSTLLAPSIPYPLEVNGASPSEVLQSDDKAYGGEISDPIPESSEAGCTASSEISIDSTLSAMDTSKSVLSMPSAAPPLPDALEVNDAIPTILQLDDNVGINASAVAGPGLGTSGTSAADTALSLNRVEVSAPSVFLASAAASLTHSAEALTGGDDAYFICRNWLGVADGVGQWSFGGIHKGLYAQEFMQNCEKLTQKSENGGLTRVKELLQQSAAMTKAAGSARVLVAHVTDQVLNVANIGDSGFIIIRNGNVFKKSSPMFHEFNFPYAIGSHDDTVEAIEEYHAELEDGDIIVTATDGLFDNLYEQEIASLVSKGVEDGMDLKDLAELLATKAQEIGISPNARTPFADAAQAAGHMGISGGKFDHVTVIVSAVQKH